MAKKPASTSLEESVFERIERIATVDRRSIAEVIAWAAEKGLPLVEEELANRSKLLEESPPYRVKAKRREKVA